MRKLLAVIVAVLVSSCASSHADRTYPEIIFPKNAQGLPNVMQNRQEYDPPELYEQLWDKVVSCVGDRGRQVSYDELRFYEVDYLWRWDNTYTYGLSDYDHNNIIINKPHKFWLDLVEHEMVHQLTLDGHGEGIFVECDPLEAQDD